MNTEKLTNTESEFFANSSYANEIPHLDQGSLIESLESSNLNAETFARVFASALGEVDSRDNAQDTQLFRETTRELSLSDSEAFSVGYSEHGTSLRPSSDLFEWTGSNNDIWEFPDQWLGKQSLISELTRELSRLPNVDVIDFQRGGIAISEPPSLAISESSRLMWKNFAEGLGLDSYERISSFVSRATQDEGILEREALENALYLELYAARPETHHHDLMAASDNLASYLMPSESDVDDHYVSRIVGDHVDLEPSTFSTAGQSTTDALANITLAVPPEFITPEELGVRFQMNYFD